MNEFPEKYKSMETMIVDKNGEYTYVNMPDRFKNSKTGKQRVVIARVAEHGKIEKKHDTFRISLRNTEWNMKTNELQST